MYIWLWLSGYDGRLDNLLWWERGSRNTWPKHSWPMSEEYWYVGSCERKAFYEEIGNLNYSGCLHSKQNQRKEYGWMDNELINPCIDYGLSKAFQGKVLINKSKKMLFKISGPVWPFASGYFCFCILNEECSATQRVYSFMHSPVLWEHLKFHLRAPPCPYTRSSQPGALIL